MPHPTLRVLAVLELLQSHGLITGAELARRVEVDARTLRRYIAMLEEMGIPITTEQGRYGGYRLVPGFKLPPMMFTDEEAQALSLGLIAARGLGLADSAPAIESVQAKLDRVLPSAPKKTIAALRESVALQTGDARVNADTKLLRVLSESAQSRRITGDDSTLGYVSSHNGTRAHNCHPSDPNARKDHGAAADGGSIFDQALAGRPVRIVLW